MLRKLYSAIKCFHQKMHVSDHCDMPVKKLDRTYSSVNLLLNEIRLKMQLAALLCEDQINDPDPDPRYLRLHLVIEETAEFIEAMLDGNKVDTLDSICDCIYVLVGTAEMFGWNLNTAMKRVHTSNMTKQPKSGPRLRDKGDEFVPVNLEDLV